MTVAQFPAIDFYDQGRSTGTIRTGHGISES